MASFKAIRSRIKKIKNGFSKSTKRNVSDYVRCIILNKPITIYTRSKSLDDFIWEMILLRNELNSIGNKFQSIGKKASHFRWSFWDKNLGNFEWKKKKILLLKKVEEIKEKINQISDKWLQE